MSGSRHKLRLASAFGSTRTGTASLQLSRPAKENPSEGLFRTGQFRGGGSEWMQCSYERAARRRYHRLLHSNITIPRIRRNELAAARLNLYVRSKRTHGRS